MDRKYKSFDIPELSIYWDWVQAGQDIIIFFETADGRAVNKRIPNATFDDAVESEKTLTVFYYEKK